MGLIHLWAWMLLLLLATVGWVKVTRIVFEIGSQTKEVSWRRRAMIAGWFVSTSFIMMLTIIILGA